MNTATVSLAVTPVVVSTLFSHYLNRKPLKQRPTAHLSYDEGLHLIRSFMSFASQHTVEDLQAFTSQWVPHPTWVKVEDAEVPQEKLDEAATAIEAQLGPDGIRQVGGLQWWQWRGPKSSLGAEWIEMRSDYNERKKNEDPVRRVMFYVHGGAYFFGSVDEHRYQMQRHARKLKARVFAPNYRLAPQFPFPCGLQDCLAAYLYLLTIQDPTTIILAGDSAGGGMVLSMLVTLRDRGIPLPAGAVLISPWVDLTHSFPSVSGDAAFDYIPQSGFHHKPSKAWPPLNSEELTTLSEEVAKQVRLGQTKLMKPESVVMRRQSEELLQSTTSKTQENRETVHGSSQPEKFVTPSYLSINLDGKAIQLKDQIQMYTTNDLLSHPLVSPIMQPTLGGLPPLLIMVGGGEILRDEQIYLAHKCANPAKYVLDDARMHESAREQLARFVPTDVQLQVWDDLCHVAPTLSFTRPAKFMYRAVGQFSAWALARAQHREIDILDDDDISVISSSSDETRDPANEGPGSPESANVPAVGKAGDELPPFKDHMIRQRVSRHGVVTPLPPATDLPACNLDPSLVGVVKEGPVRKWLKTRRHWDNRFGNSRIKIRKQRLKEMIAGYEGFDGETPPPSALASRREKDYELSEKKRKKSIGLALWSLWGSKHDQMTMNREQEAGKAPESKVATTDEGAGARSVGDLQTQEQKIAKSKTMPSFSRSRSRMRMVRDEHQTIDGEMPTNNEKGTLLAALMAKRTGELNQVDGESASGSNSLGPDYLRSETGVAGKRPIVGGIAVPFSLKSEADTASMITLTSNMESQLSRVGSPELVNPEDRRSFDSHSRQIPRSGSPVVAGPDDMATEEPVTAGTPKKPIAKPTATDEAFATTIATSGTKKPDGANKPGHGSSETTPTSEKPNGYGAIPSVVVGDAAAHEVRPGVENFVAAQEDLPRMK